MSENPATPSLPDRDQIEHLISLLTQVLEKRSDTDLAQTVQNFVTSNQRILLELQRIATSLEEAMRTVQPSDRIEERLNMVAQNIASMNRNLDTLLTAMMAPPED